MAILKTNRMSSLMGLALDERRLTVAVAGRSGNDFKLLKSLQTTLTLDPLTADPELVGREIRNRLEEAGIREQHCVVCIPLPWVLTLQVKIPEMPAAEVEGFLMIEAERGFPYAPADLSLSISRYKTATGEACATLVAVPLGHVQRMEKALRLARLKPVSFSLGISVLAANKEDESAGSITIGVSEQSVELSVSSCGGVVTLRALEGAIDGEGSQRRVDAEVVSRELRITLGQLAKETRDTIRQARVVGRPEAVQPMVEKLAPAFQSLGLNASVAADSRFDALKAAGLPDFSGAAAFGLAARVLSQIAVPFEFLPPRPSRWKLAAARFGSRKVLSLSAAGAAAVLLIAGIFAWQQWTLQNLESQYRAIKPRITALDDIEQQMRKYRAWYDESMPAMRVMRSVVEAFPDDGTVTAKTLQIRDLSEITCTGQARENSALLLLQERLGKSPQIADVKIPIVSAPTKSLIQFNVSCRWIEGGKNEN